MARCSSGRTFTHVTVGGSQVTSSASVPLTSFATEQDPVVSVTVIVGPNSTAGVTAAGTSPDGAQYLRCSGSAESASRASG